MIWTLSIILVILFTVFVVYVVDKRSTHELVFPFQEPERSENPFITINIQGIPLNMIIDSGAACSIILIEAANKLNYDASARKIELTALTTESIQTSVINIPFTIGGRLIKEDFMVYEEFSIGNFSRMGIPIHGILSHAFLNKVKGKIDYQRRALIIPKL